MVGKNMAFAVFDKHPGPWRIRQIPGSESATKLTIQKALQGFSRLRNRVIGRVFKELNLIEQWSSDKDVIRLLLDYGADVKGKRQTIPY